jgi:type VI secretion system protein ImpF
MIVFSVLDRLVDDFDGGSGQGDATAPGRREQVRRDPRQRHNVVTKGEFERYRASVRRDLEWLLNTRKIAEPLPDGLKEVERSVYCYGLPDFSQLNLHPGRSEGDQTRLAGIIARAIELFEPRILDVRVTVAGRPATTLDVGFQVSGRLKMKPRPEPVVYDTTLDVIQGKYAVEVPGERRA